MADQHLVGAGRRDCGEEAPVAGQNGFQPPAGIVVGEEIVRHRHPLGAERKLGRVAGAEHRPGEHRDGDRRAGLCQDRADATGLIPAGRRQVALAVAVADPEAAVAGHVSGVGMAEEQHQATLGDAPDQLISLRRADRDGAQGFGQGSRQEEQQRRGREGAAAKPAKAAVRQAGAGETDRANSSTSCSRSSGSTMRTLR